MDSGWVDGWTDDADPLGMKLYLKHGSTQMGSCGNDARRSKKV